jgi:hypothetical protein
MSSVKGLSQILYLIIAAAVLMFVALTVVGIAQGSLTDILGFTESQNTQDCNIAIRTACSRGVDNIEVPEACIVEGADGETTIGKAAGVSPGESLGCGVLS